MSLIAIVFAVLLVAGTVGAQFLLNRPSGRARPVRTHSPAPAENRDSLMQEALPPIPEPEPKALWSDLKMTISQSENSKRSDSLLIGYSYFILQKFAESFRVGYDIRLNPSGEEGMQALLRQKIDIMAVPADFQDCPEGLLLSDTIDGCFRWLMSGRDADRIDDVQKWIEYYNRSTLRKRERAKFLSPARAKCISPYDSLIAVGARQISWDWRLFAALICQESLFHIEAESYAGAQGLCQFMPDVGRRFGITNPLDPEQNIRASAQYLKGIYHRMRGLDNDERIKFTLAAYNAGEGRLAECRNYATLRGMDCNSWDDVMNAILYMSEDSVAVAGENRMIANPYKKNWTETAAYVNKVLSRYNSFRARFP